MTTVSRSISAMLLVCVREHDWSEPIGAFGEAPRPHPGFARAANAHGVSGLAYRSLVGTGALDEHESEHLRVHATETVARHLAVLADLAWAKAVLDTVTDRWIVIKGPVLAECVYPFADMRSYNDLDLLVPSEHYATAVDALERAGASVVDRNWRMIRAEMRGQIHLLLPGGTICDLHWDLVNTDRSAFSLPSAEIVERSVPVDIAGIGVRTPEPADTLVHLAVHAGLAGGDRLIWIKDIDLAARNPSLDRDAVATRARAWRVEGLVGPMLMRSHRWLGTPLFGPPRLTRAGGVGARVLERFARPADPGRSSVARVAARAAGRSIAWTSVAGARHIARQASAHGTGTEHPSGILSPAGEAADRAAFLAAVGEKRKR